MQRQILFAALIALLTTACRAGALSNTCSLASFSATPTDGAAVGIGLMSLGGLSVAQSFKLTTAGSAVSANALLLKTGTFPVNSQTLYATLEGNTGSGVNNYPDVTPIATSNNLDPGTISSVTPTFYTFKFSSVALQAGTIYWLRIHASYPSSSMNYITWYGYNSIDSTSGYSVGGTKLTAVYETSAIDTFAYSLIGQNRFLLFNIGC